jgi:hypothetical protein
VAAAEDESRLNRTGRAGSTPEGTSK